MDLKQKFIKYVSQNVLGMVGISFYILADTFFISQAVGSPGITALNLVLPVYGFIFAFGQMIGVGSAIRYSVSKGLGKEDRDLYFGNALFWGTLVSLIFILIGVLGPDKLLTLLGADQEIVAVGTSYTRIFMVFAPCFIWNYVCNAFVRNDGNPTIAMLATLCSSLFNILFDYLLMFPLGMGMAGAALATAVSPILGVAICCGHFFSKKNRVKLIMRPSFKRLIQSCQLGVSAFVGEFSSALITMVFNYLILGLTGNIGVAAYGVVANCSLVGAAIFNGVAQGTQPLVSEEYGKGAKKESGFLTKLGLVTALGLASLLYVGVFFGAETLSGIFNRDGIEEMADLASQGLRIYFLGFFFAGMNVVGAICLSAMERAKEAGIISISRGMVLILICAFALSSLWGMNGIWLAFPTAELLTLLYTLFSIGKVVGTRD